ncbi:hypothetical protein F4803DRAFT_552882 [Xylaria telfairii]|nr:hypothetical protein F4803DRAFT_552882 [Xylaria telfairii]
MDIQHEAIAEAYKSHLDSIPVRTQLIGTVPGKPSSKFSTKDTLLTSTTQKSDTPAALKCANSNAPKAPWLAIPHEWSKKYSFFARLGHICSAAKVGECMRQQCVEARKTMEGIAPACRWRSFRDWALTAMSCQHAFTAKQKLSVPHTHLVNAVFSCHELIASLDRFEAKMPIRRVMDKDMRKTSATMLEVCNVINWMMSIQQYKGLFPIPPPSTRDKLPGFIIGPAVHMALHELDSMKLCKNRLWNIVEVSKRKQMNLPDIVASLRSHTLIRHTDGHELCTQSKCQGAHIDSTTVRQLHKNPEGDNEKCSKGCTDYSYPVERLVPALEEGGEVGRTAWSRTERQLVPPGTSYVAISHVWSDGTGVGGKIHGHANSCLMDYFAAIAKQLECDGIWWDTLCIPLESKARSSALSKMHTLYRHAKLTVVHDLYLAGLEWTSPESACLALVFSPWFTRGWTALELAMSGDVKVIFKGSDPTNPDIRDLEADILARDPATSSHTHWLASSVIRRLRSPIRSLSDLLPILRPRSTSWVRDRTIIASLLANVPDPDFTRKESEVIQQLIKHIGFVPHAALLHGRPTMTDSGGFSWCPATLDDLPIKVEEVGDDEDRLAVQHDGSVVGHWCARPVSPTDMKKRRVQPYGSEVSVVAKFETALLDWSSCLLLYQELESEGPALLVTALQVSASEDGDPVIDCRYVGAALDSRPRKRDIINIAKFEGDPDFWRDKSVNGGYREDDSDGDGDYDRNSFHMFTIRLGKDQGGNGARAWDILREEWALRESSSDESDDESDE